MDQVFARPGMMDLGRLKELSEKSDLRGWLQVLSHFGAIGVTGFLLHASLGGLWVVPAFVAHGILINFLYAGEHELSHATVFKSPALNEWFGRLIGALVLHPRDFDQIQHFAHHRYTQTWREDGELYRPPYTLKSYLMTMTGLWVVRRMPRAIVTSAFGKVDAPYVRGKNKQRVVREARALLALYGAVIVVSLALHSWAALLYWFAPLVLTKWGHQTQNLIEHLGMPHNGNIFENTRSTRTNAFMRWLCWNMQYHTAHHAYPAVPFHRLKQLHEEAFTANGLKPATLSWSEFQRLMIKALRERPESEQPDDRVWVGQGLTRLDTGAPVSATASPAAA
jgi:fatty acid desaturase